MKISSGSGNWLKSGAAPLLGFLLFLAFWQVLSSFYSPVILPPPRDVARAFFALVSSGQLAEHARYSVWRGLSGFGLAVAAGLPAGLLTGLSPAAAVLLRPAVVVLQVVPLISWLLLAMIWLGFGRVPTFIVFVTTLPLIIINTAAGVAAIDRQLVQMARVFKVPPARVLAQVYLPQVAPYVLAGMSAALGVTWKAVAMAEFMSVQKGIGSGMAVARINLDTASLFAWTVFLVVLGLCTDRALACLVNTKLKHWM